MNKDRRKRLASLLEQLRPLSSDLDDIRTEEQDAYDAMPENFQNSDKGTDAEQIVDTLDTAAADLSLLIEQLEGID